MDDRGTTTKTERTAAVTLPQRGEILVRDRGVSDEEESWLERLTYFVVALGPRLFELLSIVLLTSGINILTAMLDANSQLLTRLISAGSFIVAGGLLFFFSAHVDRSYDDAKAQQRQQAERKTTITKLAMLAADIMTYDKKKLKARLLTLAFAIALFIVGLGTLVYGWGHRAIGATQSPPSATSPVLQAPPEPDEKKTSQAPVSNQSNNNSSPKIVGTKANPKDRKSSNDSKH
jgi:hypothetical protein